MVSDSLWTHGLQHTGIPCPSPTLGTCSNSCPLSRWCHATISSSVIPFSSCLQSFPTPRWNIIELLITEDQWLGLELSGPCTYRESASEVICRVHGTKRSQFFRRHIVFIIKTHSSSEDAHILCVIFIWNFWDQDMLKNQSFWMLEINTVCIHQIFWKIPRMPCGSTLDLNIQIFLHLNIQTPNLQGINMFSSSYPQMNFGIRLRESIILRQLGIWGVQILGALLLAQSSSSKAQGISWSSITATEVKDSGHIE